MDSIEQQIAQKASEMEIENALKEAVRKSMPDAKIRVHSVAINWLEPSEHSFEFSNADLAEMHAGYEVHNCFTVRGFEDIFTAFVLLVPATTESIEDFDPDKSVCWWFNIVSQFGMVLMPQDLMGLCLEIDKNLPPDEFAKEKERALNDADEILLKAASSIAISVSQTGRETVINRFNDHLKANGKPPMVVL